MIEAVIFDMDGLLINSEPFWQRAEIKVFNDIGIPMTVELCNTVMGKRIDEVVKHWRSFFNTEFLMSDHEIVNKIQKEVIRLVETEGEALPGVYDTISILSDNHIPIALASSSSTEIINAVLYKLNLQDSFQIINSAENLNYGKPHPEIFLNTAKDLNVIPSQCLVFEDSFYGMIAGIAAGMRVVTVPENFSDKRFDISYSVLPQLTHFSLDLLK